MNVTYYLTIDKVLVHFGSEVRKVSYRCAMQAHPWHVCPQQVGGYHCTRERTVCAIFYLQSGPTARLVMSTV